jgi:hypothetical protein
MYFLEVSSKFNNDLGAPVVFLPFHKKVNQKKVSKLFTIKPIVQKTISKPKTTIKKEIPIFKKEIKKNEVIVKKEIPKKEEISKIEPVKKTEIKQPKEEKKEQDPIYIGQQELDALQIQNMVQKEVSKNWKTPIGMKKGLICRYKILIDWDGKAKNIILEQDSKSLAYNISAKNSIIKTVFPLEARGKELIIDFKP